MSGRALAIAVLLALAAAAPAAPAAAQETVGPGQLLMSSGRHLDPLGRMTPLGAFPTGGALSPDGRFYWTVDAGRGANGVRIVDVATGVVTQVLQIPGGYVGVGFAPDGRRAYVSGQAGDGPLPADIKGKDGDVIHVYDVDPVTGTATERDPLALPDAPDGAAANDELPPASGVMAWPEGLAVMPDGKHLVVALGQADSVAIIELASGKSGLVKVGRYPYGVAADPRRPVAYVSNERDGTVTAVHIPDGKVLATIGVGGARGGAYAHPEGLAADPIRDRMYAAVADRDRVAVINTKDLTLEHLIDVSRRDLPLGTAPVSPAVSPDGQTLYVADAGEDAIAVVALADRPPSGPQPYRKLRSVKQIRRYRQLSHGARGKRLRRLQRRLLYGSLVRACGGPREAEDRVWVHNVLRALDHRAKGGSKRAFARAIARAKKIRVPIAPCRPAGFVPGVKAFSVIGRLATAAYPHDVEVTPDGRFLVWLAAKGLGTGPNPAGESIKELLVGRAGVLNRPTDRRVRELAPRADKAIIPANSVDPPPDTPVRSRGPIKHVFYVVKENRTYDQLFGSDPRGRGNPAFELFGDNGKPPPTGGVTPNAHALTRSFSLLDNVNANSEESTVGHKITAGAYANDYTQRYVFTNRGRKGDPDIFAIGVPPNAFVFDQAVRQGISFRAYGELGAGNQPFADDGRPTFRRVLEGTDYAYPSQVQGTCEPATPVPPGTPNEVRCTQDSGDVGATHSAPAAESRVRVFAHEFQQQVATNSVPTFNYLILFNDHTNGTIPGDYTPKANVADNDLALGQVVELVSQSSIWEQSAILVVEDDSQDGIDSVDAHRIPAFVISPWAKRGGGVIHTRYDQYSFLRTAELLAGLNPLSINDALAVPLYEAFTDQPDVEGTRYRAIQPQQSLSEVNPPGAPDAELSRSLPWSRTDEVPQRISDVILWHSVHGAGSKPPPPGPHASLEEHERALEILRRLKKR